MGRIGPVIGRVRVPASLGARIREPWKTRLRSIYFRGTRMTRRVEHKFYMTYTSYKTYEEMIANR